MDPEAQDTVTNDPTAFDHIAAARDFLNGEDHDEPADDSAPPETKKTATPATDKVDPIASVLKLPGVEQKQTAEPAADAQVDDIAKGLQAPPETAKSRAGWEELKVRGNKAAQEAAQLRKEKADLEAKLKSSPGVADEATKARLAQLEQENKTYSERLKVLDLKSHPEFQAKYIAPQSQAKQALASIAKDDEVEVNVDELLSLRGKKFNAAVSETLDQLTPYARVKFQSKLDEYISATLGAEQALTQADEFLKNAKQSTGAKSRAVFDEVAVTYKDTYAPAQVDDKADDAAKAEAAAWNQDLANIGKQAEVYAFGAVDERTVADLAHKAALYDFTLARGLPKIGKVFEAHMAKREAHIAELEAKVKALTVASPSFESGSGAGAVGEGEDEDPADHIAAARKFMAAR